MYVEHLSLTGFRSYGQLDTVIEPGITVFVGPNGVGKTNIVEAIGYLATLSSHRVSTDTPLIAFGEERAIVRGRLVRGAQRTSVEVEINASSANRARINRSNPVRAKDAAGILKTVLFAPEDLTLVKGDPSVRRRYLDEVMVSLLPHQSALRADYERVLKQRNALLKSARAAGRFSTAHEATLDVWDQHLAESGARLLSARLVLVDKLRPHVQRAYQELTDGSKIADLAYASSVSPSADLSAEDDAGPGRNGTDERLGDLDPGALTELFTAGLLRHRRKELERGISLVGPHRDELTLLLGSMPVKGYASHGETWSMALALRLASYYLLLEEDRTPGGDPVLILDDAFAELDAQRRTRLASIVASAEQVLITAAVGDDIPAALVGRQLRVIPGAIAAPDDGGDTSRAGVPGDGGRPSADQGSIADEHAVGGMDG
ncbi:DNA replication/repair protein RecF [Arthrobacter pityocampae]|uniref:DNA replication and repair protein RecF n=1 Tax=Arthrobacter pityocampae TaxID=547334 RepID=A0A2S5IVG9_9MICC|nr:DNA replication/repair protein RecF [Arthrobacter pityocampae]PPB48563.1 DNA replication/repair protein RecF [Arthrobacter pityocampae]